MMSHHLSSRQGSFSNTLLHNNAICLIVCYFGQAPVWLQFFFKSCGENPGITFLIFTDCIDADAVPANVEIVPCTLEDIKAEASRKLGLNVQLDTPYKLCDLKAAYGVIFSSYLKPYTFWGMTDLDIVFGDIKAFVSDDMLTSFDVVNGHTDYLVGHFSLYRNTAPFNQLFLISNDYKQVFESPELYSFAECNFAWTSFSRKKTHRASATQIESLTHVVNRLVDEKELRKCFLPLVREKPQLHKRNWLLQWQNGKLYDVSLDEEIMYLHFHLFKQSPLFQIPGWHTVPDTFYINKHGFFR